MGARRKAREAALQALFYMDHGGEFTPQALERFRGEFTPKPEAAAYFERLVRGVMAARGVLDPLIERYSENWSLERMGGVDRNVMRIALFEMLCCEDIPYRVSIDEAVDLGKKFGGEESGAFINGIVDRIRLAIERGEVERPAPEEIGAAPGGGAEEPAAEAQAGPVPSPAAPSPPAAEAAAETDRPRRRYVRPGGRRPRKKVNATGGRS